MNEDDIKFTAGGLPWEMIMKSENGNSYSMPIKEMMEMYEKLGFGRLMEDEVESEDERGTAFNKEWSAQQKKTAKPIDNDWGLKKTQEEDNDAKITSGFISRQIKLDAREAKLDERETEIRYREEVVKKETKRLSQFAAELDKREKELRERESIVKDIDLIATAIDNQE